MGDRLATLSATSTNKNPVIITAAAPIASNISRTRAESLPSHQTHATANKGNLNQIKGSTIAIPHKGEKTAITLATTKNTATALTQASRTHPQSFLATQRPTKTKPIRLSQTSAGLRSIRYTKGPASQNASIPASNRDKPRQAASQV